MNAISQSVPMPRSLTTSFSPFGKTRFPYTTADSAYSMPAPMAPFDLIESNIDFNIQSRILNTDMDWPYGTDDMFDNLASQGIPLQVDAS